MQYHPPSGSTDPNAPYVGKNVAAGTLGSKVPPGAAEYPQREIVNTIALSGQTPADADQNQLARAIRGGQLDFDATDTGTADAVICQVGLAHSAIAAGLPFTFIKGPAANTGNAVPTLTITDLAGNNGLTGTIVKSGGGALAKGDLPANALITVRARAPGVFAVVSLLTISDVLALIQSAVGTKLTGALTVYVRPDGSDTANNGLADLAAGAFRTPQGAYNYLTRNYFFAGYSPTIQLSKTYSPGSVTTYPGIVASNVGVTGTILLQGDPAAPQNYVLNPVALPDGTSACAASGIAALLVSGVTLDGSTLTSGSPIRALVGGTINRGNCIIKMPSGSQPTVSVVQTDAQGTTARTGPETVLGQGGSILAYSNVAGGGADNASTDNSAVTISNLIVAAFYNVVGRASVPSGGFVATNVAGPRYKVFDNGVLALGAAAETSIPGSTAGIKVGGGQVDGAAGSDWTAYTPIVTGTGGTVTAAAGGQWRRVDKTIFFWLTVPISAVSASPGTLQATIPPFASSGPVIGSGRENGATGKGVIAFAGGSVPASGNMSINLDDASTAAVTGYNIAVSGWYQTAI